MAKKVFVLVGNNRVPMENATDEQLKTLSRVVVESDGTERLLTQADMRTGVLMICRKHGLSFRLAME